MNKFLLLLGILGCIATMVAQDPAGDKTRIDFVRADDWNYSEKKHPGAQMITGNVVFRHDSAYLYCDTAFFYKDINYLEAFSNVRMEQGDTLFIYGDQLYYNGNERLLRLRNHVRMENNSITLLTDSFNYDRNLNLAYFFDGGVIIDEENDLSSVFGQYDPERKEATFRYNVKLKNPKMDLSSDTLHYNTVSKVATILGPSEIISDSTLIRSSKGWYNIYNENAMLLERSTIHNKNTLVTGDSICYNRLEGIAEIFGRMYVNDTLQKAILRGNYGFYNELNEFAWTTDSALCMDYSTVDTMYIHADTIRAFTVWGNNPLPLKREKTTQKERDSIVVAKDSIRTWDDYLSSQQADSLNRLDSSLIVVNDTMQQMPLDTIYRKIKAYFGVRIYSDQMQAVCDSMTISSKDSIINMYQDPIIWSDNKQLFGDFIQIYIGDSTLEKAHVQGYVFSADQKDSLHYDQIYGREMFAYFDSQNSLRQIDVNGNVNCIYFPIDDKDSSFIGMVKCESSFLTMTMKEQKMERIKLYPEVTGVMKPMINLKSKQMYLDRFAWYYYIRPLNKNDIYRKRVKKETNSSKKRNKKS